MGDLPSIIDPVKMEELRKLGGDTNDFLLELLNNYQSRFAELITEIEGHHKAGNLDGLRRSVHSLKGATVSLGLLNISRIIKDLDAEVKQANVDNVETSIKAMRDLEPELLELIAALQ